MSEEEDGKIKILAVDDVAVIRRSLGFIFKKSLPLHRFELLTAESAEEAFQLLEANVVRLILLDWMLPAMDGVRFLKQVREQEKHKNLPVIMLTSVAQKEKVREALVAGADDYLVKPIVKGDIIRKVLKFFPPDGTDDTEAEKVDEGKEKDKSPEKETEENSSKTASG